MRIARICVHGKEAGILEELEDGKYRVKYLENYMGEPISLTMPVNHKMYDFEKFPPFFEGLLPEGVMLEGLLRKFKLDRNDYFSQLLKVGRDMVGAVTVEEIS